MNSSPVQLRSGLLLALLLWPLCSLAAPQVLVEAGSANKYLANSSDPGIGHQLDCRELSRRVKLERRYLWHWL